MRRLCEPAIVRFLTVEFRLGFLWLAIYMCERKLNIQHHKHTRSKHNGNVMLKHCFDKVSCFRQKHFFQGIKDPPHFWGKFHWQVQTFIFLRNMKRLFFLEIWNSNMCLIWKWQKKVQYWWKNQLSECITTQISACSDRIRNCRVNCSML